MISIYGILTESMIPNDSHEYNDRSVVSSSNLVSSTNKTDRHDITEIVLNVALNTTNPNPPLR
jgi:hypothetical protein